MLIFLFKANSANNG